MKTAAMLLAALLISATAAQAQHSHPVPALPGSRRALPPPIPAPPPPPPAWKSATTGDCVPKLTSAIGAAEALVHGQQLALTPDQVRRLELLRDSATAVTAYHLRLANERRSAAAVNLTSARPDLDAFAARLRESAEHRIEAELASARFDVQARSVLTAMQRDALARMAGAAGRDTASP